MPTKAECDFFVSGSSVLETACCSESIRMSHDAKLVESHVVVAVGISHATSETHGLGNLVITKGRTSAIGLEKLTERFGARNTKHVYSPTNIDHSEDRVEDCYRKTIVFAYREVVGRFVESEPDMDGGDNVSCVFVEAGAEWKYARVLVEQGEIVGDECYRKTCQLTSIARVGNACVFSAG